MKHDLKHEELQHGSLKVYFRLLKYLKPHLWLFSLSVFGYWLMAATDAMLVFFTKFLIEALENTGKPAVEVEAPVAESSGSGFDPFGVLMEKFDFNMDWLSQMGDISPELTMVPVFVLIIYLFRGIGIFMGNYVLIVVAQKIVHKLRVELFNKLTALPGTYFDSYDSGSLISKITFNVMQVNMAITDAVKILIREGSSIIVVLIVLFILRPDLTLIFIAVTPLIAIIVSIAGKHLRRYSNKVQASMGRLTSICSEMIGGYRVMRTYGGEEYEKRRFAEASLHNTKQNTKIAFTASLATAINQFFVAIALAILMYVVIAITDPNGASGIIAYMFGVGLLPKSMKQISDVYNKIQRGLAAAHSIFLQIDEEDEKDLGTLEVDKVQGQLQIRNLSFTYPDSNIPAIQDINLDIEAGKVVAFVGVSGSGKSTLVSLIPRYYDHQQGEILLDGREINEYKLANLRKHIALVSQDVVLFNDNVRNNIAYGDLSNASDTAVTEAARAANALDFINQMPDQFDTVIGEDGSRLSGGQRQRISIARALLKNAPILIFDEATSALDNEAEKQIQAALEKLSRGRTTLIIAHRLSTIENADKIVVMKEGTIAEVGTHQDLLAAKGEYAKLYNVQFLNDSESLGA